jgi:hypothetical protein
VVLGAVILAFAATRTVPAFNALRSALPRGYLGARRAASVLRTTTSARARVFCDDAAVEVFSELPGAMFVRWRGNDVHVANLAAAAADGVVPWVVSRPERVRELRAATETLYEDGERVVLRFQ